MSWFKGDDRLHSSEKWAPLSFAARGLWAHANSWVSDRRTDGHVPRNMLRAWAAPPELAAELVEARLWDEVEGGWNFHNWLEYNPSREQLEERSRASNSRVTAFRERKKRAGNSVSPAHVTRLPDPVPDPVTREEKEHTHREREELSPVRVGNDFMLEVNASQQWNVGSWRKDLETIGEYPATQRAIALTTIRTSRWCLTNPHMINPGHVVKYWNKYASGRESVTQVLTRGPTAVPTQTDYAADAALGDAAWET